MQEQLVYIQNVALALGVLFVAYLATIPLRRRYAPCDSVDVQQRSGGQFLGVLLSYPAFSVLVLLCSVPAVYWFYRTPDPSKPYAQTWYLFWGLYAVVRFVEGLFVEGFVQMGRVCPLSRLTRGILRLGVMMAIAFLLIRYQLDQKIGVLLTSTAIVTGVIGFAMQGVLGNLLAGMSIHACRTLAVGDWVSIDGLEGQVTHVNWRETRLRAGGHIMILPNGKVADAIIRNYSSPNTLRRHAVPISASYGDAPGDVIAALVEAADCVPDVLKEPKPDAYVTAYKDFCIDYVLRFWSNHYENATIIQGEVMRMIWYKFNRRGIEIPFPMSGRVLDNFMQAVHAQRFEKPLASDVERSVDDMLRSDFGCKLLANSEGVCLLSRDELRTLARNVRRVRFTHGETLMRQGEYGELFYTLVQGKVHGCITNSDTTKPIEFDLQTGTVFGEMSLLTGLPRSATMTATTDCELLEFDRDDFTQLLGLREEIPRILSDLAATRTAQNAASLEKLKASTDAPAELARDGIFRRLKRMLNERRNRQ
ncbi:MAG: cyclic nucleotide-binding domain-containing protein [Solirubrobacterales bacterium]